MTLCEGALVIVKDWHTSSYSTGANNCVEVRFHDDGAVDVRNSKDPQGPAVRFTAEEWSAFRLGVQDGEFNLVA